ncbi:MAG: hypothetical protein Q9181_002207 [Wetmoreana brouardii]
MAVIEERVGNIFDSPPNSSPSAFLRQKLHCTAPSKTHAAKHQESLLGTCLLIAPQQLPPRSTASSYDPDLHPEPPTAAEAEKRFWIACLYTSRSYGKNVDPPASILSATASALEDLRVQIHAFHAQKQKKLVEKCDDGDKGTEERTRYENLMRLEMEECYSVRINSGLFGVPWEETKAVLEKGGVDMVVVRPPDEGKKTTRKRKAME